MQYILCLKGECTMKKKDTRRIRLQQACTALDVNITTLWRWAKRANIKPVADEVDKRVQTISIAELQQLARAHDRPLLSISGEIAMQEQSTDEEERIANVEQRIAELEQDQLLSHPGATPDFGDVNRIENRLEAMEGLVEGLEQRIEHVEQLLQDLVQERPPQLSIVRTAPPVHDKQVKASSLPGDLVIATSFAKQHGIAESTLKRAIADGRLYAIPGSWHVGRVIVKWALDDAGRAQFYELYHEHPKFHRCEDCPHELS
jgi:hypothetical protein